MLNHLQHLLTWLSHAHGLPALLAMATHNPFSTSLPSRQDARAWDEEDVSASLEKQMYKRA